MKKQKFIALILLIFSATLLCGCENATFLNCAYFSNITMAGSKNYGVRIAYFEDSRLEEKGTDVQFKFNKLGTITFWEEGKEKHQFKIEDIDEWYSMTTVIASFENKAGQEQFERFKDVLSKAYIFNYDGKIEITLRVVAGEIEKNSAQTGEILTQTEPISNQYTLKIK